MRFVLLCLLFGGAVASAQQSHYLRYLDRALRSRSPESFEFRTYCTGVVADANWKSHQHSVMISLNTGAETRPPPSAAIDIFLQDHDLPLNLQGAHGIEIEADISHGDTLRLSLFPEPNTSYGSCGTSFIGAGLSRYVVRFSNLKECWSEGGFDPSRVSVIRISNERPNQQTVIRLRGIGLRFPVEKS